MMATPAEQGSLLMMANSSSKAALHCRATQAEAAAAAVVAYY